VRLSCIIFSILISISSFASDWKTPAEELLGEEGKEEVAIAKLSSLKDLDSELKKALEKEGRDEQLALNTIRKMPRLSLVDTLIAKTEKMDVHEQRTAHYLVTLLALNGTSRGADIMKFASKKIDLTAAKISASLRIALLSAMYSRNEQPSIKTMTELLDDVSYEMRLKAMDVALSSSVKDPSAYESFLKKGLHVSPYPVRLKALDQIKLFPKEVQARYKEDIEMCAKTDQDETVRENCKSFRF
jgi:hypothetical protein